MNRHAATTTGSSSFVLRALLGGAAILALVSGPVHAAPNRISFSNGVDPPFFVTDGDAADLDGDADEIRYLFHLEDASGDWVADGEILATTTNPNGATLVVTNTDIVNVTGDQILGEMIHVDHYFDPIVSFTQQYTAHIDGAFDKLGGGILGNLIITYAASLNGAVSIGNYNYPGGLMLAPETFAYTGAPHHLDTVTRQTQTFIFYIDEIDNLIRLYDSATILPAGPPAPGFAERPLTGLALLLLAVGGLVILRERRNASGRRFFEA